MHYIEKKINWMMAFILFINCSVVLFGSENMINSLVAYLAEHDIIMTQNVNNNYLYEGYDFQSKANYKAIVDTSGEINDFTVNMLVSAGEKYDYEKIKGLMWFLDHYLEKNTDFFDEIKTNIRHLTSDHSFELDLGEWKLSVLAIPTGDQTVDLNLHFIDDASRGKNSTTKNVLGSLKNIYQDLGCIERDKSKTKEDALSYKLPYYKLNAKENVYYHSFINKHSMVYKTQIIYYKNGFDFDYRDIPQLKQIIILVTNNKNYPFEKLNVQFEHLKQEILSEKNKDYIASSSWKIKGSKSMMELERYPNRDQTRIKITINLAKK